MKKNLLIILISIFFLSSCSEVFRDFKPVKDMKWFRKDAKIFKVNIPEKARYNFIFAMRFPTGFPYKNIKIKITRVSKNTEAVSKNAEFAVINEKNQYQGEVSGELWDLEEVFSENEEMQPGEYVFKIEHAMVSNPVLTVIDIGLIVSKSSSI